MFDARSWARWIAAKRREETARCEREGRIRSVAEINEQVREIDHWLVTGKGTCQSTYVLHRRVLFGTPVVTPKTLSLYIRKLLRFQAKAEADQLPEFLLDADSELPTLYVLEDMSSAARHTGPHVQGRVVDRREMLRLVRNGLRASSDAIWLLLEDGKDGSAEG